MIFCQSQVSAGYLFILYVKSKCPSPRDLQLRPWDGKKLFSEADYSPKTEHHICDLTSSSIKDHILNIPQALPTCIGDVAL